MRFFDTNILIYAVSRQDERKRVIAQDLLVHAMEVNGDGCITLQVLCEFVNTLRKKRLLPAERIRELVSGFSELLRSEVTYDMVMQADLIAEEYGLQFYDAQIIAAAEKLGCHEIVSEDLNAGQIYRGMVVVNPFVQ